MIVKIIKSAQILSFYSFMNIFLIFILTSSSLSFASLQEMCKVDVIEFSFDPKNEEDMIFKRLVQKAIINKLKQSQKITKVEFISTTTLSRLGKIEEFCKRKNIRYIVEGKMWDYSDDKMRVEVVLKDMTIEGNNKEKWGPKVKTLKKDTELWEYWFEKISGYIYKVIEGTSIREVVFTYCFEIFGDEDNIVREIKLSMPKQLKLRLEDNEGFSQKYILETFHRKGDLIKECEERKGITNINKYEYIIEGDIELDIESGEYEVTVELYITDTKKNETLIEGFKEPYTGTGREFFDKLAERIIREWSNKIDK